MSNKYQTIKAEFEKLFARHGKLTPEIIVEEASKKTSKLYPFFEWNNAKAAHQWRLEQASMFLRTIKVTIEKPDGEEVTTRAYVCIKQTIEGEDEEDTHRRGEYQPIDVVLADDRLTKQMLEDAKRELRSFQRKYHNLRALAPVMEAIGELLEAAQ